MALAVKQSMSTADWSCTSPDLMFPAAQEHEVRQALRVGSGGWNLVAANLSRGGNWTRPLFRGSHRVPSACRRYQRHWVCRIHVGACGGSARPSVRVPIIAIASQAD